VQPIYEIRADAWADGSNAIVATSRSSFAVQPDGSLWAWGNNGNGQLGDGTNVDRHSPVKIMDDVVSVESNDRYTMAVTTDNTLWIWGQHDFDQPEEGDIIDRYVPTKLLDDVVAVASNDRTAMAIRTDGSLWAAGVNSHGLLARDPDSYVWRRNSFDRIMDDVAAVSIGFNHALAIRTDGSLWSWGRNDRGQLGDGTTIDRHEPVHIMNDVISVSTNHAISIAVQDGGDVLIWGSTGGTLPRRYQPDPDESSPSVLSPHNVAEGARTVSLGNNFILGISIDNGLYGIANNNHGQLGDGTNNYSSEWIRIMDDVDHVVAGNNSVIAIDSDGSLWAWGNNERGRLGDNTTTTRPRPVKIMDNFMSMGAPVIFESNVEDLNPIDQQESVSDNPDADEANIELPNIELPDGIGLPEGIELPGDLELPDVIGLPGDLPDIHIPEDITITHDTQQTTTLLLTIGAFIIILIQTVAIAICSYLLYSLSKRRIN